MVLNLLSLETVVLVLHVDGTARLISVFFQRLIHGLRVDNLRRIVLLRLHVLVVISNGILASHLIVLQLIILRLGLIVFHIDYIVAAVIFVLILIVLRHDVLEIWILVIHQSIFLDFLCLFEAIEVGCRISGIL